MEARRSHRHAMRAAGWMAAALAVSMLLIQSKPARADEVHVVQPGETLGAIAQLYGLPLNAVALANSIHDVDFVWHGQSLTIPSDIEAAAQVPDLAYVVHSVQAGEILSGIADRYGVSLESIVTLNGLTDKDWIHPGQQLEIPSLDAAMFNEQDIETVLANAEAEFGIPNGLLRGLAWQESGWQQHVVSSAGAIGLTQVMPSTAKWATQELVYGAEAWETDPWANARVGAAVLRFLLDYYGGDIPAALAGYYQGIGSLQTFGVFDETYQYMANVMLFQEWFAD